MAEQLSEREQQALDHLRKAEELEVTLAEYCRSFELDVKELYASKQSLVRKGALPSRTGSTEEDQLSDFVAVQVAPPAPAIGADPMCRIRHPNGLIIECASWPPKEWMMLLCGGDHVPT